MRGEMQDQPLTSVDPGARHADWTLARILREPATDVLAQYGRASRALILGAEPGGPIERCLTESGLSSIASATSIDAAADPALGEFELVVLDPSCESEETDRSFGSDRRQPGASGRRGPTGQSSPSSAPQRSTWLGVAAIRCRGRCLIVSDQVDAARADATAAGLAAPRTLHPPTDAERRFVLGHRVVISAGSR